ncbi:MAG: hypothetical protein ACT4PV_08045 [Planctomycetaceae bacterium]
MAYIVGVRIRNGDKPGKGTYRCLRCNWRVSLEGEREPLPPCSGECKTEDPARQPPTAYERVF